MVSYALLSLINSRMGTLGPDTGGKVATLRAMSSHHSFANVDVGYWASQWDPTGVLHPLFRTTQVGHMWIQVSTLPMILAGEPLWRIGGYRAALLIPMAGGVACAYGARALARLLGSSPRTQWTAFWVIGLASPVTIYALDFWEHTVGLALMVWGTVALLTLLECHDRRRICIMATLGGLAFGAAATMRTEAFVYLAVTTIVVGVFSLRRDRRLLAWMLPGACLVVGTLIPLATNAMLSAAVIGKDQRSGRSAKAVGGIGSHPMQRLSEGLQITFGMFGSTTSAQVLTGLVLAMLIGLSVIWGRRRATPTERIVVLLACSAGLYGFTFMLGFDWITGMIPTAPLAAAGIIAVWKPPWNQAATSAALSALIALPAVWLVRWTGGQPLQWSGRYILCTMLILVVLGVCALPALRREVRGALLGMSIAVTVFGLAWMSVHTHNVDRLFTNLDRRPESVLVADGVLADLPREGGAFYGNRKWLVTLQESSRAKAADIVTDAGFKSFALVHIAALPAPKRIGAYTSTATTPVGSYQHVPLLVTSYHRD